MFKVVQDAQYRRLAAIYTAPWVQAMAHLINSKKPNVFRWHDSGDVQDLEHLNKIYDVCRLTPSKRHWMPTREAWVKDHLDRAPSNLVIRFSAPMIDQAAPASWPNTSTVVTAQATCSAPQQDNQCKDCEIAGILKLKIYHTASTNGIQTPKYYKELRKRNKSDQAISLRAHDGECERASDPGHK